MGFGFEDLGFRVKGLQRSCHVWKLNGVGLGYKGIMGKWKLLFHDRLYLGDYTREYGIHYIGMFIPFLPYNHQ